MLHTGTQERRKKTVSDDSDEDDYVSFSLEIVYRYIHINIHTYIHIYINMHVYMYVCMWVYI